MYNINTGKKVIELSALTASCEFESTSEAYETLRMVADAFQLTYGAPHKGKGKKFGNLHQRVGLLLHKICDRVDAIQAGRTADDLAPTIVGYAPSEQLQFNWDKLGWDLTSSGGAE